MKYFFAFVATFLVAGVAISQSPMRTTAQYNGQQYHCYIIEYNLPPDETENVIKEKLRAEGYSGDKSKGFIVYRNVRLKELNIEEPLDVLFKIERKSRKEKEKSLVTLITAKAGLIPEGKVKGASTVADIEPSNNSALFLNSFKSTVLLQAHYLAVADQEDRVAKEEKILTGLQNDQVKLEKKISDYQSDLEENKKDQQMQSDEIAKQEILLSELKKAKPIED